MNWKFRRGHGGFVLGLGAITLALGACAAFDATEAPRPCEEGSGACDTFGNTGGSSSSTGESAGAGGNTAPPGGMGGTGNYGGAGDADAGTLGPPDNDGGVDMPDGSLPALPPDACAGMDMEPKALYLSADDSNSMGSPGYIREIINLGFEPSPSRIRTYEFLNYYRIAYNAPEQNKLAIFPEMAKTDKDTIADFQFAIRSYDILSRRPMNFTFLVDTSGSMKGPGITRAKDAVRAIASQLIPGDIVSLITTDGASAKLDGHVVTSSTDPKLNEELDKLTTGGTTDLLTALSNAYDIAEKYKTNQRMNRVVLISDGGVNVGVTESELLAARSADALQEGIYLVGIGVGPALTYNDKLMNDVTDAGRGAYVYLDTAAEATRILADRFDETMDIAARAVQVKLTLPWYFRVQPVSTEQASEVTKVEPQHLAPNDAMVFFLQTTACDASFYNSEDPVTIRVSWKTRDTYSPETTETTVKLKDLFIANSPTMAKGRAIVAYAEALKGCGFDKKGYSLCLDEADRQKTTKEKLVRARDLAMEAKAGMPDAELDEIIEIISNHVLIKP